MIRSSLALLLCGLMVTFPDHKRTTEGSIAAHPQPPGPGSIFRYKHWYTFADAPPQGPHMASYDSVIARGTKFDVKDNVLIYAVKNSRYLGQAKISYESNGDVAHYEVDHGSGNWESFPLCSKDTVVFIKGKNPDGDLVVDTNTFLEQKDTTIEGHFWHAIKIRQIVSLSGHTFNNEVLWYDAETGWYIRMDMPPRHPFRHDLPSNGEEVHVFDCKINP